MFMKTKIIRKLLAIFLAISAISATPGLVIAGKEFKSKSVKSNKAQNVDKKKSDLYKNKFKGIVQSAKNRRDEATYLKFNVLLSQPELSSDEKIKFLNFAKQLPKNTISTDDLDQYASEIIGKLLYISKVSSDCDDYELILQDVSIVMYRLFCQGCLKECELKKRRVSNILNILHKCKNSGGRGYVAETIRSLVCKNSFNIDERKIVRLLEILKSCIEGPETKRSVATAILGLESKKLFDKFEKGPMQELVDILNSCASAKDAKVAVSEVILHLSEKNLLLTLGKNYILKLLETLNICAGSEGVGQHFAKAVVNLAEKNLLYKLEKSNILETTSTLCSCAESKSSRLSAIKAVSVLAAKGFLDKYESSQFSKIIEMLYICSSDVDCGIDVANVIIGFVQRGLIYNKCSKDDIKKIVDMMGRCINQAESEPIVLRVIFDLFDQGLLDKCGHPEIMKILSILRTCGYNEIFKQTVYYFVVDGLQKAELLKSDEEKELAKFVINVCDCSDVGQVDDKPESDEEKSMFYDAPRLGDGLLKLDDSFDHFGNLPESTGQTNGVAESTGQTNGVAESTGQANGVAELVSQGDDAPELTQERFLVGDGNMYGAHDSEMNIFELDENGDVIFKED